MDLMYSNIVLNKDGASGSIEKFLKNTLNFRPPNGNRNSAIHPTADCAHPTIHLTSRSGFHRRSRLLRMVMTPVPDRAPVMACLVSASLLIVRTPWLVAIALSAVRRACSEA
jgi:hypothetical protein